MKAKIVLTMAAVIFFTACDKPNVPKPKSYPRIDYPAKSYVTYSGDCPYTFEMPIYARIEPDDSKNSEPCWFNILYAPFNARLHISYKTFENRQGLMQLEEETRGLVYKHTVKAEEISEDIINTRHGVLGMYYTLEGNTATAIEFYLTDTTHHFLHAVLYFKVHINRDSLDPMIEFLRADINRMINTFQWTNTPNKPE
jgi:gliding motility-associated lipoprotein GldD